MKPGVKYKIPQHEMIKISKTLFLHTFLLQIWCTKIGSNKISTSPETRSIDYYSTLQTHCSELPKLLRCLQNQAEFDERFKNDDEFREKYPNLCFRPFWNDFSCWAANLNEESKFEDSTGYIEYSHINSWPEHITNNIYGEHDDPEVKRKLGCDTENQIGWSKKCRVNSTTQNIDPFTFIEDLKNSHSMKVWDCMEDGDYNREHIVNHCIDIWQFPTKDEDPSEGILCNRVGSSNSSHRKTSFNSSFNSSFHSIQDTFTTDSDLAIREAFMRMSDNN